MPRKLLIFAVVLANAARGDSVDEWLARVEKCLEESDTTPKVLLFTDDWSTGGNWYPRYRGRGSWCCGMGDVWDFEYWSPVSDLAPFKFKPFIGENCDRGDGLRRWVHWPYLPETFPADAPLEELEKLRGPLGRMAPPTMDLWTWRDVRRVLLNPKNGGRRQASYDDHAEGYKPWFSREGPHLYLNFTIPQGRFIFSLYFVNPDSHWGGVNRFRDYVIQVKEQRPDYGAAKGWESVYDKSPLLAETRGCDFFAGVYKRFILTGPLDLTFSIRKGESLNAILSGIFLDDFVPKEMAESGERIVVRSTELKTGVLGPNHWKHDDKGELGNLSMMQAKLTRLRTHSPKRFLEFLPTLVRDVGVWSNRREKESAEEYFYRLERVGTLLHMLLEYDARDRVWKRYGQEFGDWVASAPNGREGDQRAIFSFDRLVNNWYRFGVTAEQLGENAYHHFRSTFSVYDERQAVVPAESFGKNFSKRHPHQVRQALLALEEYYQRKKPGHPFSSFSPEAFYSWGECHQAMLRHGDAFEAYESFLQRFPKHKLAAEAKKWMEFERPQAQAEHNMRNPVFRLASVPPIVLPRTMPWPGDIPIEKRFDWDDPLPDHE